MQIETDKKGRLMIKGDSGYANQGSEVDHSGGFDSLQ